MTTGGVWTTSYAWWSNAFTTTAELARPVTTLPRARPAAIKSARRGVVTALTRTRPKPMGSTRYARKRPAAALWSGATKTEIAPAIRNMRAGSVTRVCQIGRAPSRTDSTTNAANVSRIAFSRIVVGRGPRCQRIVYAGTRTHVATARNVVAR